jgi:pimeloyl-ACP methyl ester carboxylesterase
VQPWPAERVRLPRGVVVSLRRAPAADRPPVLLVHGLGGSSTNFTGFMHELAGHGDFTAVDLPGFGLSPAAPSGEHGVPALADAVVALIERHLDGPVHLVGNSMGGLISTLVAASRPDLVRSVLLVAPALPTWTIAPVGRMLTLLALPRVGEQAMARMATITPEEQVRTLARDLFGDPDAIPQGFFDEAVEERRRRLVEAPWSTEVFLASLRSMIGMFFPPRRLWSEAARIQAPTTVVYGGRDRLVTAAAHRWHAVRPATSVVVLPRAGHVAQMERPDLVAPHALALWRRAGAADRAAAS